MLQATKLLFIFSLILTPFFPARAGLLIEPLAGFMLQGKAEYDLLTDDELDSTPMVFGLRVGISQLGFMAGIEHQRTGGMDFKDTTTNFVQEFDGSETGLFVGYSFPILLRVWGGYMFSHKFEDDRAGVNTHFKGNGLKLGAGVSLLPLVSLNLEYKMYKIDEFGQGAVTFDPGGNFNAIVISASVPLNL